MDFPKLLHLKLNFSSQVFDMNEIFQHAPQLESLTLCLAFLYDFTANQECYSLKRLSVISPCKCITIVDVHNNHVSTKMTESLFDLTS